MADCLAIIGAPITKAELATWASADDFVNLLHVETLSNVCATGEEYEADPFCVDGIAIEQVCAMVLYNCETGVISSYGMQCPAVGLSTNGEGQLCVCLEGWCEAPPVLDTEAIECEDLIADPCVRYTILYCAYLKLIRGLEKAAVTYNNRSIQYCKADLPALKFEVECAKTECGKKKKCRPKNQRRFGVSPSICARRKAGLSCGCC